MKLVRETRLLKLRAQQEKLAELQTAHAARLVTEVQNTIQEEQTSIAELSTVIMEASNKSAFTHLSRTAMVLRLRLQECEEQLVTRQSELQAAREVLLTARRNAETLRLLLSKKRIEIEAEADRASQAEIDDASLRKRIMQLRHSDD